MKLGFTIYNNKKGKDLYLRDKEKNRKQSVSTDSDLSRQPDLCIDLRRGTDCTVYSGNGHR